MNLFFYGTLMHPSILQRVLGRDVSALSIRQAILLKHGRHRVLGVDYPAVVEDELQSVQGRLVDGLNAWDLKRLDIFEGEEYDRRQCKVKIDGQEEVVEAQTYVWIDDVGRLDKTERSFEDFVKEKLSRWVDKEDEYTMLDGDTTGGADLGQKQD
jgi:gamma-glutamylcyclotransferase (GGCT)/AIG2-like uncharacterized protein YtfP